MVHVVYFVCMIFIVAIYVETPFFGKSTKAIVHGSLKKWGFEVGNGIDPGCTVYVLKLHCTLYLYVAIIRVTACSVFLKTMDSVFLSGDFYFCDQLLNIQTFSTLRRWMLFIHSSSPAPDGTGYSPRLTPIPDQVYTLDHTHYYSPQLCTPIFAYISCSFLPCSFTLSLPHPF